MFVKHDGYVLTYRDREPRSYIGHYTAFVQGVPELWAWLQANSATYEIVDIKDRILKLCTDSQDRPVCDIEYEYEDGGAWICGATYYETGEAVPEEELEYLTDTYPEMCDEAAFEAAVDAAEAWGDAQRGH